MEMVASGDSTVKVQALRGAVRLLNDNPMDSAELVSEYASLLSNATTSEEKMIVLGGISQMANPEALDLAFTQFKDASVKDEAVQAAINIARNLGASAAEDADFFNGNDLAGWTGNSKYWSVDEGAIVGGSDGEIPQNEFLWSNQDVADFYLVLDVLLEPNAANAGIQFRSKADADGHAQGYQADVGEGYWGRLYHEHGRGMLDDTDTAENAVKPGEWNRYEILAVGPAVWTAINGTLGTAYLDLTPDAERSGKLALQIHSGPPISARYRIIKLVHNPEIELENANEEDLMQHLRVSDK
jgi:hypothetical protein